MAKQVSDRTYTRCGSTEYTSPEMLLDQGVNQACDWWALGVLTFELLVGETPFSDENGDEMQTYMNILKGDLSSRYPASVSVPEEAKALIAGLCTISVPHRLGYLKGGVNDIIEHEWLASLDWDGLINGTLTPPWHPEVRSAADTQHFEEYKAEEGPRGSAVEDFEDPRDQAVEGMALTPEVERLWADVCAVYSEGSVADLRHMPW